MAKAKIAIGESMAPVQPPARATVICDGMALVPTGDQAFQERSRLTSLFSWLLRSHMVLLVEID